MKSLLLLGIALVAVGCSGGSDDGDVAAATAAQNAQPKSAEDLPAGMDAQARTQAAGGISQRNAADAQMNQQMEAMKRSQSGGK